MAEDEQRGWLTDLQRRGCHVVQVTYPRTANNEKELSVVRGEFLEVIDDSRNWWKCRNSRGQFAHVPHTIVVGYEMTVGQEHPKSAEWVQCERRGQKRQIPLFLNKCLVHLIQQPIQKPRIHEPTPEHVF